MAIKKHLDYKENNLATIIKSISRLKPDKVLFCFIIWLAPRAGKMSQILRCDWLPERARWSYLARSGLPVARPLGIESLIPGNSQHLAKGKEREWNPFGVVKILFQLQ